MKGKEIIESFDAALDKNMTPERLRIVTDITHIQLLELHARALACHCECLGMNAENCQRTMRDQSIAYNDNDYALTMKKWNLINEEGEPSI